MQDAVIDARPADSAAPRREVALPLRSDTILGVCQAIGEDFGFNPTWLRVALCLMLFANPAAVIGGYFALGLVVAASRLLFPKPAQGSAQSAAGDEDEEEALPLAA